MAGQGGTAPPGQQPEPLIEPGADLRNRQRTQPGRGEFQGQRNPVQARTDRRHRRGVGVVNGEALRVHGGVLREQLHRLERAQLGGGGQIGGRDCQRGTRKTCSPLMPTGSLLVTSRHARGQDRITASASLAAAPSTCSALSRTSNR